MADGGAGAYADELVFSFVHAVGISFDPVLDSFGNGLKQFGYQVVRIKFSDFFDRPAVRFQRPRPDHRSALL